jgi:hypothetical protein
MKPREYRAGPIQVPRTKFGTVIAMPGSVYADLAFLAPVARN